MAHTFEHTLDEWAKNGTKSAPSSTLKSTGFVGGMKPPASVFNYQWDKIAKAISELQQYALTEDPSGGIWQNLAAVATSGNYNDLLNKPAFKAVATSGDYADLINKPIAAGSYVGDGTGTAQMNSKIDPTSYSPRRISLALTPNVVMLMDNTGCVLAVTKSNAIMGYAQCRFYNSDQGKWYTVRGESPTKLAYIEGATLSLISSANAPDSNYLMQGFYTSSVEGSGSLVSTLNISGVTYYYLAF